MLLGSGEGMVIILLEKGGSGGENQSTTNKKPYPETHPRFRDKLPWDVLLINDSANVDTLENPPTSIRITDTE